MTKEETEMTLFIDNRQDIYETSHVEDIIKEVIYKAFEISNINYNCQVSVTLVDNEQIREINKTYRNIDLPTDVLSFPLISYDEGKHLDDLFEEEVKNIEVVDIDTGELVVGDIIISLEKAYSQSQEYGHSYEREIAYLAVHGMLHLMGYDHERESDKVVMRQKEEEILSLIDKKR